MLNGSVSGFGLGVLGLGSGVDLRLGVSSAGRSLRSDLVADDLDNGHGGVVTLADANASDASVTAVTTLHAGADLGEKDVHDAAVGDRAVHETTIGNSVGLSAVDELLGQRANALGFGDGGHDAAMLEELAGQVAQNDALVSRGSAKTGTLCGFRHSFLLVCRYGGQVDPPQSG